MHRTEITCSISDNNVSTGSTESTGSTGTTSLAPPVANCSVVTAKSASTNRGNLGRHQIVINKSVAICCKTGIGDHNKKYSSRP